MKAPPVLAANLTHDCGTAFQVAYDEIEQLYTCPGCGISARLDSETVAKVMAGFGSTLLEARRRGDDGCDPQARLDCRTDAFDEARAMTELPFYFGAHAEMQDASHLPASIEDAPGAATIELAKLATQFADQIGDERRAVIIHIGGALMRLHHQLHPEPGRSVG